MQTMLGSFLSRVSINSRILAFSYHLIKMMNSVKAPGLSASVCFRSITCATTNCPEVMKQSKHYLNIAINQCCQLWIFLYLTGISFKFTA